MQIIHRISIRSAPEIRRELATLGVIVGAMKQKAPFQLKSEPKWGRNGILQLHWVFDAFLVTPDVWRTVFQPHGVGCRPVLGPRGAELQTVVQLLVQQEVGLALEGLAPERCEQYGRLKYPPVRPLKHLGPSHALALAPLSLRTAPSPGTDAPGLGTGRTPRPQKAMATTGTMTAGCPRIAS